MSQIRNSYNAWSGFQTKQGAKPRNRAGGAKRRNWALKPSFKSVCFVRTRNDESAPIPPLPVRRSPLVEQ